MRGGELKHASKAPHLHFKVRLSDDMVTSESINFSGGLNSNAFPTRVILLSELVRKVSSFNASMTRSCGEGDIFKAAAVFRARAELSLQHPIAAIFVLIPIM